MVSTNFINECKNRANANRLGRINIEQSNITISQSDKLKSILINEGCYIEGSIIGSIYIKKLIAEVVDSNDIDLIDKTINAKIGVKYDNNATEYIEMGKYTVERPTDETTANISQITAYDDLINNIDKKYESSIDYTSDNITLSNLYADVCRQLELTPKTTIFLNSEISIANNPFGGNETNRMVLQTIAKIACSFVTIDRETNEIDLSWLSSNSNPDYTFEKSDYSTLTGGTINYGPINSVTIKNSIVDDENVTQTDAQSIEEFGEHSVIISDDYVLHSAELRRQAITGIFERLNGLKYVDSELITYYGKPFLKLGDKIRIITDDGFIDTYVLVHDFMYDGTFYSCIKSPVLTEQEVKTKQNISLSEVLKNTQFEINKQAGEIKAIVKNVDEIEKNTAVTTKIDGTNEIVLENICESEPISLKVYPTNIDMGYLRANAYFKAGVSKLTSRDIIFKNGTNEKRYPIPCDLYRLNDVYDEFILNYNTKECYCIHRIGLNSDGYKYLLENEIREDFDYPTIILTKGNYKIYFESFNDVYMFVELMTNNTLTNQMTSKVEFNATLELTRNSFQVELDKKVDDESYTSAEILMMINNDESETKVKSDKINLNGYISNDEGNFEITQEGKAKFKDITVTGGDIRLPNGGQVIGGDGLLSNLQYKTANDYQYCGFSYYYTTDDYKNTDLGLSVYIPENFTIKEAKLTLFHMPMKIHETITGVDQTSWCYCRNLKLYKENLNNYLWEGWTSGEVYHDYNANLTEITDALGSNGFTPTIPTDNNHSVQSIVTNDIKSSLSSGTNNLLIRSDYNITETGDLKDYIAYKYSGRILAFLNVIGYMSVEE